MVGPNCMGLVNTDPQFRLNATFGPVYPAGGEGRPVLPERSARARAPRLRVEAEPRDLDLRVRRQQGRRLGQRPDPVLGGGSPHRGHPAVPRELRQSGPLLEDRPPSRAPQADRRRQVRPVTRGLAGRLVAHRRARGVGPGRRRPVAAGGRHPHGDARGALRRRDAARPPAGPARPASRDPDQRRRAGDPRRRRLRGSGPGAARALSQNDGRLRGVPSRRGERRQSRGHARLGAARALSQGREDPARRRLDRQPRRHLHSADRLQRRRGRRGHRRRRRRRTQARPRDFHERQGRADGPRAHPLLSLSRVGGHRARALRDLRGMEAAARRKDAGARQPRFRAGARRRRTRARARRRMARARRD